MLFTNASPEINEYLEVLTGKDVDAKAKAVDALVGIGAPAVESLIEYLSWFGGDAVGAPASEALARIGEPAVEPLIAALSGIKSRALEMVIQLLRQIGDRRAVEPLVSTLDSQEPRVSSAAAEALDTLGWQPDDGNAGARYWSVKFLFAQGTGSEDVRQRAAQALKDIGWQPDASEAGAAYWIVRREWEKCAQIGQPAVKPLFITLQDADESVWQAAVTTLVNIGEPGVETLTELLHDYFRWAYADATMMPLRVRAANVLGEIGDPRAIKELIYMGTWVERTSEHRVAAADALAEIGEPAIAALLEIIKKDSAVHQELGAWALGKIGDMKTVGDLIPLLSSSAPHHKPHVRRAAREALQAITSQDHAEDVEAWQAWWEAQV